jgi:S-adenosylmethionine decarboxylase
MSHLFGVLEGTIIERSEELAPILESIVKQLNLTEVNRAFHQFSPRGTTGVIVLSESHLSAHTYPEDSKVYLDLFCCSKDFKPDKAAEVIKGTFGAEMFQWECVYRF